MSGHHTRSLHFVHPFVPLARAECADSLPFSAGSSIPLCNVLFPATILQTTILPSSLTSSCHLFLGPPINLVVSKFIYDILLGIFPSSVLCTCPNRRNLFNLIVSIIVGFFNTCIHVFIVYMKNQLDVTFVFFISLLIAAQHVSGNHVPIIRS